MHRQPKSQVSSLAPTGQAAGCSVRVANEADLRELKHLESECFSDPWSEEQIGEELRLSSSRLFVATSRDRPPVIFGYVALRIVAPTAELLRIAVAPAARRRGIASSLLQTAIQSLHRDGVGECLLELRDDNTAAQRLYARFGADPVGSRPGYYRDGARALILRIDLRIV